MTLIHELNVVKLTLQGNMKEYKGHLQELI